MSKLNELRARYKTAIDAAEQIVMAAEKDNGRALTADETKKFEELHAEAKGVAARIEQFQVIEQSRRLGHEPVATPNVDQISSLPPRPAEKIDAVQHRRRYGRLVGYEGPGGEERAHRAGMWLRANLFDDRNASQYCRDHGIGAVMSSATNTAGGFLIPDELSTAMIDLRETYGVFRRLCQPIPMGSDVLRINRRTGGTTAYFVGESQTITASDPSFDQVELIAKKMACLTLIPRELAADATMDLASWVANEHAYAMALKEDQSGFTGTGTSTYGGIVGAAVKIDDGTHTASVPMLTTGHTSFATLTLADFHAIVATLPMYAMPRAAWYVSSAGFAASMQRLSYASGGNTVGNIVAGTPFSFLGFPVYPCQVLNSTLSAQTSTVVGLFGDLRLSSILGSRSGIMMDTSDQRYFELDQIALKTIERLDINNHSLGDTSTAGPLIAIKTPSS